MDIETTTIHKKEFILDKIIVLFLTTGCRYFISLRHLVVCVKITSIHRKEFILDKIIVSSLLQDVPI